MNEYKIGYKIMAALVLILILIVVLFVIVYYNYKQKKKKKCCPKRFSSAMFLFNSNIFNISNTNIIGNGYITNAITEFSASYTMTRNVTLSNLFVNLSTAPGGSNGRIFTIRVNGVDTLLTATLTGVTVGSTNTDTKIAVLAGDRISLQVINIGVPSASTCQASVQYL